MVETNELFTRKRPDSVNYGTDAMLLVELIPFYVPDYRVIVDVTANTRRMWKKVLWYDQLVFCDIDPTVGPDICCDWSALPFRDNFADVIVYDPPHLEYHPRGKSKMFTNDDNYGIKKSCKGNNIISLFPPFLSEAQRVLRRGGVVLAKIKDYISSGKYQWNSHGYVEAARSAGLEPFDLLINRHPSAGKMTSSSWIHSYHSRNCHVYWLVTKKLR